uniref:Complement factor B n=1 Tax=Ailuropoda melanoleuca TaxID=9646 RepID=A0A7N5J8X0_AILME
AEGLNPTPVTSTTKHVIILLTDGKYNMGGCPAAVIEKIKEFLKIGKSPQNPRDNYLDIFIFGSGNIINIETINELASHKPNERHSFLFKDLDDAQEAFQESIGDGEFLPTCGFSPGQEAPDDYHKFPWFTGVNVNDPAQTKCKGVIVSERYVLTAAHCFTRINRAEDIVVMLGTTQNAVAEFRRHPEYDKQKLQSKGIQDFYDYDAALVKLAAKNLPPFARPICLPCTAETTRALRKPHPQTTCKDHEEELLYDGNIPSFYITNCEYNTTSLRVWIKNGGKKIACHSDAKKATLYEKITNVSEVVTDRFLCTGGTDPEVDPNICEYDAGGPLLTQRRQRSIQLGVVSWSVVDACRGGSSLLCNGDSRKEEEPLPYARDF